MRTRRIRILSAALLTLVLEVAGCSRPAPTPPAEAESATVDPGFVHGTDGGDLDRLAATVISDVQAYWAATLPAVTGRPWHDLDGGFFSVDTTASTGRPPPCSGSVSNLEGNAYYCASVDAIAWDRAALLPVLREHYGDAAVAVVLAHEVGHAVQQRSGVDVGAGSDAARVEAGADCYAGAFLRAAADGRTEHLRVSPAQLDQALHALIVFRDPIGTDASSGDAHGTSFDRITAFQDGHRDGPGRCADVPTERAPTGDAPDDGNAPLQAVVDRTADAGAEFFGDQVAAAGRSWTPPAVRSRDCPADPVGYCAERGLIGYDPAGLDELHRDVGDQATATLLASRHALAALTALGRPTSGAAAGRAISCLTGAYTATEPGLSAGDLDEAIESLLVSDSVSRDATGGQALTGGERVAAFRTGLLHGPVHCG
ncbi:neutral zinc metallopeptidase [Saccharopolyspora gloriosae]|uniref:Putative metalloprotease n=1 Tax=Saccharopolyspora gloriosae TaxID=455344 RepID=A0A840NGH6_9PSEU|nr:putative metalloprotease [Saccharopolyspora gloriosae]